MPHLGEISWDLVAPVANFQLPTEQTIQLFWRTMPTQIVDDGQSWMKSQSLAMLWFLFSLSLGHRRPKISCTKT